MRTTLHFAFGFCGLFGHAQSPVYDLFGNYPDNIGSSIVTSATPINQETSGANAMWDFSQLSQIGLCGEVRRAASPSETATFPNTTSAKVLSTLLNGETTTTSASIFTSLSNGVRSITGSSSSEGFEINYSTDNALIGTFPLTYGYSNTDATAGTYVYGIYSGTFTGTITSSVDGYGTLHMNNTDSNLYPDQTRNVTRFKTVQNISINYGFLTNAGTVTITSYSYSSLDFNGGAFPLFQSITTSISVPLLSINQTTTQMIRTSEIQLATKEFQTVENVVISPNPAANFISIKTPGNQKINSLNIYDSTGKQILTMQNPNETIGIGNLQNGLYFITIQTDLGTETKKIVKK